MKLGAMVWSERGKQTKKTGNEYIKINITSETGALLAYINVHGDTMAVSIPSGVALVDENQTFKLRNIGNLKYGN